jgi:hypothetical protein
VFYDISCLQVACGHGKTQLLDDVLIQHTTTAFLVSPAGNITRLSFGHAFHNVPAAAASSSSSSLLTAACALSDMCWMPNQNTMYIFMQTSMYRLAVGWQLIYQHSHVSWRQRLVANVETHSKSGDLEDCHRTIHNATSTDV